MQTIIHRLLTLVCLTLFISSPGLKAQQLTTRNCGTKTPGVEWDNWFNAKVKEYQEALAQGKARTTLYTIPVVVHVIHGGQAIGSWPNISQAQVNSQIPVLNADYAGTGLNSGSIPSVFAGLKANCNISFCLARYDADGNCLSEPGIDRVNFHNIPGATNPGLSATSNDLQNLFDNIIKPATIWDPSRFLNIWVSDVASSAQILGYASFPPSTGLVGLFGTGTASTDGVWVWSQAFGTTGSLSYPYNQGRTATHEIGHWVGLRHTWGDSNCGTDYCNDTPPSQTSNFGCPAHPFNLGVCAGNTTGEMFMNFMDYANDACLSLFTNDQNTRIQTAMANSPFRNKLTASSATLCNATAAAAAAVFTVSTDFICVDSVLYAGSFSTGAPCPSLLWSVQPTGNSTFAVSSGSIISNTQLKFKAPGTYTLTLNATNASGANSRDTVVTVYDCNDATGIAKTADKAISVRLSPNPGNGSFNLDFDLSKPQDLTLTVRNTLGQMVYQQSYKQVSKEKLAIDLSAQPAGVYNLTVTDGAHTISRKLLIAK